MLPGGLSKHQLRSSVSRDFFHDYMPWTAFDPENYSYLTQENAFGYIWECTPIPFMDETVADVLAGILRLKYTDKALIQIILYADPNVDPFTDAFLRETRREDSMLRNWAEGYAKHLRQGNKGIKKMAGIPTRLFRVFVCIKNGEKEDLLPEETITGVEEFLKGAHLNPRKLHVRELLAFIRGLLCGYTSDVYDDNVPIRKQILRAQDEVDVEKDHIRIGERYFKILTPKVLPEKIDVLKTNQFFGGVMGATHDPEQIDAPFLYSMTILPKSQTATIAAKSEVMNLQRAAGSFLSKLKRRLDEYDWALGISDQTTFLRIIPSMVVMADSFDKLRSTASRVTRLWEGKGAIMQEERIIQQPMFLCSLPLGIYNVGNFIKLFDRDFIVPSEVASRMMPVQADFMGGWPPRLAYVGRKGQLIGLDIFSRQATNHNILIAAGSGSGKSVATQHMLVSHYRSGCKVRVIDIGYSYRKLTRMLNGTFIDVGEGFVLNPFDNIKDDSDIEVAKAVISQMCFSNQASVPDEITHSLIGEAVDWVIANNFHEDGVSKVAEFLRKYPEHSQAKISEHMENVIVNAHTLAYTMREFVDDGTYAKYFRGKSTLDVDRDDWTVLELEKLLTMPALFTVVVLMVIQTVTSSLYLAEAGDRKPTFILFDEAWKFLNQTGGGYSSIARVIEEGMRRARKYKGSFSIVTQSITDMKRFGAVGDVINANTQFKFFLKSPDYQAAQDMGLIDYDPFTLQLLKSVTTQRPRYSEIFIDGGEAFGIGVARLVLDSYSYWLFTSDANDNDLIEQHVQQGMSYAEAISVLASKAA